MHYEVKGLYSANALIIFGMIHKFSGHRVSQLARNGMLAMEREEKDVLAHW